MSTATGARDLTALGATYAQTAFLATFPAGHVPNVDTGRPANHHQPPSAPPGKASHDYAHLPDYTQLSQLVRPAS